MTAAILSCEHLFTFGAIEVPAFDMGLALLVSRVGCARVGAARVGYVPKRTRDVDDIDAKEGCFVLWSDVRVPATTWTLTRGPRS